MPKFPLISPAPARVRAEDFNCSLLHNQYSFLLLSFAIQEMCVCSLQKMNRLNYLRNSRKPRLLLEPYFIVVTFSYLIELLLKT